MWQLQIKRSRVRFPHWNFFFFFSLFFFFSVSFFPPFFFLHARSAISMLKHFSSVDCVYPIDLIRLRHSFSYKRVQPPTLSGKKPIASSTAVCFL